MTLPIYIPSLGRGTPRELTSGPLADLPAELRPTIHYVVPRSGSSVYSSALGEVAPGVSVLQSAARGIAATRFWIGNHAAKMGWPKFIMLDDDIRFLVRRSECTWQLRGTQDDEVVEMLWWVEHLLDTFGHVGISPREGNNRSGEGPLPLTTESTRTLRALAYRTDDFLSVEHGRVQVMEDFDVNLQLLERGVRNCSVSYWAQGQKMTQAEGGCSSYRTHEVQEESARRLAELHPGLVELRTKQNKTDTDGFGTRTEVTIQWKQALR